MKPPRVGKTDWSPRGRSRADEPAVAPHGRGRPGRDPGSAATYPGRVPPSPTTPPATPAVAVLLAAGAGTRLGRGPKALLPHRGGTLVEHATAVLLAGGCDAVVVVLGAEAERVRSGSRLDDPRVRVVDNPGWATGMASSLRVGVAPADEQHPGRVLDERPAAEGEQRLGPAPEPRPGPGREEDGDGGRRGRGRRRDRHPARIGRRRARGSLPARPRPWGATPGSTPREGPCGDQSVLPTLGGFIGGPGCRYARRAGATAAGRAPARQVDRGRPARRAKESG